MKPAFVKMECDNYISAKKIPRKIREAILIYCDLQTVIDKFESFCGISGKMQRRYCSLQCKTQESPSD